MRNKKILQVISNPVGVLYKEVYGTETTPWEELSYIGICLGETIRLVSLHWTQKISSKIFSEKE
jgi:hypothetical protein